jgi:large subunit ribosomal protein L35Ae
VPSKVEAISQPIYGKIMSYRIGIRTQHSHECLIHFNGVDSVAQAGQLLGQKVVWKGEKRKLIGKVIGFHGKNGTVRVKFRKGVPGQALGTTVELAR